MRSFLSKSEDCRLFKDQGPCQKAQEGGTHAGVWAQGSREKASFFFGPSSLSHLP